MPTTFRSGPRDPRTGATSTVISPGNIIRADGRTDDERSQMASQFTADPGQEQQYQQAERDYREFLQSSGRSSTNPYGDSGLFGASANWLSDNPALGMSQKQIDDVNRLAYNQYLGLVSGRGTQRGGQGEFVPGYAPALKIGSNTPRGRVVAAPTQPEQGGGIADFFKLSPTLGLLKGLFGSGDIPRTLDGGGVDYSTEGIETLDAAPVLQPGEAAPMVAPTPGYDTLSSPAVGAQQPSGFILASTMPRKDNGIFNLPLDQLRKIPETGIGGFIEQGKDGFQLGPGKLKPEFNVNDGSFGLTFKIPIAANPNFSLPPNPKTETDAEFEARYERQRADIDRKMDQLINEGRIKNYLAGQSDVGVYTPPPAPRPLYDPQTLTQDRRENIPQQYGGFADPLVGGTLSDLLNRRTQEQRLNNNPLPNSYSPRRIAREALVSGRRFQQI